MEEFKKKEKQILWFLLIMSQSMAMLYRFNISFQLLINTTVILALGSFYSIHIVKDKRVNVDSRYTEIIDMKKALVFPFIASGILVFLYVLFLNVHNKYLGLLFRLKFSALAFDLIGNFMVYRINYIFPNLINIRVFYRRFAIFGRILEVDVTTHKMMAYSISATICGMYVTNGHWTLNNMVAIAFAIGTISAVRFSKLSTLFIFLLILVVYDTMWVFGTDVMTLIADRLDAPLKLMLPVSSKRLTLIGLGDIIIPGILSTFALKFDVDEALKENNNRKDLRTPVFYCVIIGYIIGLIAAFLGMSMMNRAQPALLYLLPSCSLGLLYGLFTENRFSNFLKYKSENVTSISL